MCAQNQQPATPAKENSDVVARQKTRVISLLEGLADQARASENLAFAVRAQSQAAALLWSQDPERARVIFRDAFQALKPGASSKSTDKEGMSANKTSAAGGLPATPDKRQLRSELLNQIAARDPELADELARDLADSIETSRSGCVDNASPDCSSNGGALSRASTGRTETSTREEAERRELLMSAALQIVERDPQQAMTFSQMSLALGISSNFARLLTLMRAVDAERADLLFSNAVERLEQSSRNDLADVHTLGTYVVSAVNSSANRPLAKAAVVRFLNLAFNQITRSESAPARGPMRDQSAALYFIGRQLTDLFARYLPDHLGQWQRFVNDQANTGSYDYAIDADELRVSSPSDIARDAGEAPDGGERDSLYARAALGWLAQGEVREAQEAALRVSDTTIRDRVLTRIVRWYSSHARIEDSVGLVRRIADDTLRVDAFVMLGGAALASKDTARSVEMLNEAESCALKTRPSPQRADSLIKIASTFAAFDVGRSFEVLQSAVKAINELINQQRDSEGKSSAVRADATQTFTFDGLYAGSFESMLATLAKADFDRALVLAQQLTPEEASLIAQLAVCRGGLSEKPSSERSASDDEAGSGVNH